MNQLMVKQGGWVGRGGVSVVGLMVVVGVIGMVIAFAMPAQMRSRQIQHARTCQENMARISGAVEAYALQNSLSGTSAVALDDLVETTGTGFLRESPECPVGGTYRVNFVSDVVQCSVGENPGAGYAPHVKSMAVPRAGR